MARPPRSLPSSAMLHLIARGNNGIRLFRNRFDFTHFSNTLHRFIQGTSLSIHHYALMRTHIHLLAWVERTSELAEIMKAIFISYQSYYRRRYEYRGHLWHGRFRSIVMKNEEQWLQCARYIELNPVHACICKWPEEYRWSSYHFHALGKPDPLIRIILLPRGADQWQHNGSNAKHREFVHAGIHLDYQLLKKRFEKEKT